MMRSEIGICHAGDPAAVFGRMYIHGHAGLDQMEKKRTEIAAMYFVNHDQIEQRLRFLQVIAEACQQVLGEWGKGEASLQLQFSQERVLHLAIESVTDVGSLLIDAFILRDASSYEDIVDILHGEGAFSEELAAFLSELVKLRKPLTQDFVHWDRGALHPLLTRIPKALTEFAVNVRVFMEKELA
jgi:uncharacterized protein YutE (UPF0331/DUF86 family)